MFGSLFPSIQEAIPRYVVFGEVSHVLPTAWNEFETPQAPQIAFIRWGQLTPYSCRGFNPGLG